jgi:valyl-tRNA synthetase
MTMEKTFDAAAAEAAIYAKWEAENRFAAGANAKPGAESFCIVIPPPNVTGNLHMGHALNNTLQDILTRWKRMQGYDVLWQPGQDHAGIATQMVVERELARTGNQSRREMGREKFLKKVWEWKEQSGDTIINQLKRLGATCDWSRNRFTMDEGLSEAVLKVFVGLYKEGLIYKDKRLVNWDPHFETAISDLEVEQVEMNGKLWRFNYPLEDGTGHITVATTRPETMLGDTGVAVHPDDERYAGLIGKHVILPLVGRRIPIVADEYADPEKGSGAVKITPAHDFNDWQVGKRCDLRVVNVMDSKAAIWLEGNADFLEGCEPSVEAMALHGLDRYEARKRIVALADDLGWLDGIDEEVHMVPHGDRSKVAIEPFLTDQWFVDAKTLAGPAAEAVRDGGMTFHPQNWEKTYFQWMDNIEPWCISRQLWWGHQIPVWYDLDGNEFCAESEQDALEQVKELYEGKFPDLNVNVGVSGKANASYIDPTGRVRAFASNIEGGWEGEPPSHITINISRDPDVLDTWFSSALWPFSTMGWPEQTPELAKYYPGSVLMTAFDIIFFWVARMMMMSLHFMKDGAGKPVIPFHDVYIHALVLDEKGQKMSKSKDNGVDPLELVDEFGADALRFTLAAQAAMGRNIRFSVPRVAGYRNFGTKLWNAARFAEMNECRPAADFDPAAVKETVNKWIVGETAKLREQVDAALAAYRFNDAAGALYGHVWGVFCDWYVEFAKPLLTGADAAAKAETQATMAWALDQCVILLHPIMPFITEQLWGDIAPREKPLIHADWPTYGAELVDAEAAAEMDWIVKLIEAVRSVRAEMNVNPGAKVPLIVTEGGPDVGARLERNRPLVERLARTESIEFAAEAPRGAVTLTLEEAVVRLPLAGVIDVAAESARLEKARGKAEKECGGLEKKLANQGFLAKAPEDVIEEQRERLASTQAEVARLDAALARLKEMA